MTIIAEWLRRVGHLIRRRRLERDLQREMEAHRALMTGPQRFGNTLRLREEARDVWGWNWLDNGWQDLKFASRSLRQSPGFTLGAILVLTLGIGLNVTFFQIYNLSALKPLNVRNPETLVELHRFRNGTPAGGRLPYPAMEYIRENSTALSSVLVSARQRYVLWEDGRNPVACTFCFGELVRGTWRRNDGRPSVHRIGGWKTGCGTRRHPVVSLLGEAAWQQSDDRWIDDKNQ